MTIAEELRETTRKAREALFNDLNSCIGKEYQKILGEAQKVSELGWYQTIVNLDESLNASEIKMIQQELSEEGLRIDCVTRYNLKISWE